LPGIAGWRNDLSRRKREHISIRNSRFRIGLSSTVHSVRIAHFREDFTTDFTDCTDGKEKKKVGKLQLFQNTASAGFQSDTNLNTIFSLVPGKIVSVALSSSAILAAN